MVTGLAVPCAARPIDAAAAAAARSRSWPCRDSLLWAGGAGGADRLRLMYQPSRQAVFRVAWGHRPGRQARTGARRGRGGPGLHREWTLHSCDVSGAWRARSGDRPSATSLVAGHLCMARPGRKHLSGPRHRTDRAERLGGLEVPKLHVADLSHQLTRMGTRVPQVAPSGAAFARLMDPVARSADLNKCRSTCLHHRSCHPHSCERDERAPPSSSRHN